MAVAGDSIFMKMGRRLYMETRNVWGRLGDMAIIAKRFDSSAPRIPSHRFSALDERRFLSLHDQKFFKSSFPRSNIKWLDCVGSSDGWLIMVDATQVRHLESNPTNVPWALFHLLQNSRTCFSTCNYFLDPECGDKVMLPSQSTIPWRDSSRPNFFKKVVASSGPTSSHCLVAALCPEGRLAFCRPGDQSWSPIDRGKAKGVEFGDIEIIDGRLHAALKNTPELLMVFEIPLNANRTPSFYAKELVTVNPVPILPRNSSLEKLFRQNILHRKYSIDLRRRPLFPWTNLRYACWRSKWCPFPYRKLS